MSSLRIPDISVLAFKQYYPVTSNLLLTSIPKALNLNEERTDNGENSRGRTSEYPLLHKSNKNTDKSHQNQLFQNYRNEPKACSNQREFIQEQLTLSKNSEAYGT